MKCDGKAEFSVSHAPQKSFYNADLWLYFFFDCLMNTKFLMSFFFTLWSLLINLNASLLDTVFWRKKTKTKKTYHRLLNIVAWNKSNQYCFLNVSVFH